MKIQLPKGVTERDLEEFLKALNAKNTKSEPTTPSRNCSNCLFYEGECSLYSSNCATVIFNKKDPPRWLPKEDALTGQSQRRNNGLS